MLRGVLVRQLEVAVMVRNLVKVAVSVAFQPSQVRDKDTEELLKENAEPKAQFLKYAKCTLSSFAPRTCCRSSVSSLAIVDTPLNTNAMTIYAMSFSRERKWTNQPTSRMGLPIDMLQMGVYSTSAMTPMNCLDPPRLLA